MKAHHGQEVAREERTLLRQRSVFPRVLEIPAFLYLRTASSADPTSVVTQDVDRMEHDDVGGLQ